MNGTVVAAVERKTLEDLAGSLLSGRLTYALAELAALPRAAVVVEERFSRLFSFPARAGCAGGGGTRRSPGAVSRRTGGVLRNSPTRRGMDLPLAGRLPGGAGGDQRRGMGGGPDFPAGGHRASVSGTAQRPSAFARWTSARPAGCIRPSAIKRAMMPTFRGDHELRARRGVKRCR